MGFEFIYWTPVSGLYFLQGSTLENFGKFWKTAVFPGGFGRIGEIPHGRIWPNWCL